MNDFTSDEIRMIQERRAKEAMRKPMVAQSGGIDTVFVEIQEKIRKMSIDYQAHAQKTMQSNELGSIKMSEAARLCALADGMNLVFDMLQDMRIEIRNKMVRRVQETFDGTVEPKSGC